MNPSIADHPKVIGEWRQHESYYPLARFQGLHGIRTVQAGVNESAPLELNTR